MARRTTVGAIAAATAATLLAGACSGVSATKSAQVLSVATTAEVTTWNPIKSFSTEVHYLSNVYEPLLRMNPPGAAKPYRPVLATGWTSSDDARTWTFQLRKGVTFHDGEPMDAAAVKASIEAAAKDGGAAFIWAALESIQTPDPHTVVFKLKDPAPVDKIASSMYGAWIVSPKALAKGDAFFKKGADAGTGPYRITEYKAKQKVVLSAYDKYWGGWKGPHYRTVEARISPEPVAQQQMVESGQVDLATALPLENVGRFRDDKRFAVTECATLSNHLAFFNTVKGPLKDPDVRRALAHAIPYDDIVKVGAEGFATRARGPVPRGVFPYDDTLPPTKYDLAQAKKLLAQAGHSGGGGMKLTLTYAAENAQQAKYAPLIKDSFAKLGVTVELKPILFNQQWEQAKADPAKAQDIFLLMYWPTYSDAGSDNLVSLFRSSEKPFFNLSYWKDDTYDGIVDEAGTHTATDPKRAAALYRKAQERLLDQAPGAFLYDMRTPMVMSKQVKGFACNANYSFSLPFYDLHGAAK